MNWSDLQELGPTGALVAVALIFGVLGLIKGVAKVLCFVLSAVLAIAGAYFGHAHSGLVLDHITTDPAPWMRYLVASTVAIGLVSLIRLVFRIFFISEDEEGRRHFGVKGLLVGTALGVLVMYSGLLGINYAAAIDELKGTKDRLLEGRDWRDENVDTEPERSVWQTLSTFLKKSELSEWQAKLDPLNSPERLEIAKSILAREIDHKRFPPGSSQNPIIAEAVDEEDLSRSVDREDFGSLLISETVKRELERRRAEVDR